MFGLFQRKPHIPAHVPADRVYDFDVFGDSARGGDVHKVHMNLRQQAPDIFYTPRNGGHWMVTRFADVQKIMVTPEQFSSRDVLFPPDVRYIRIALPPQDMDAPQHMHHRMLLTKFLAPREIARLETQIRQLMTELIDATLVNKHCEFMQAVAVPLPVKTFMGMMQMDLSRYTEFVSWANNILGASSIWKRLPAFLRMRFYMKSLVRQRQQQPGNDPVSMLLAAEVEGQRLSPQKVQDICNLLFLAGLDTVTNAMTYITKHLAENPDHQQRLREHPEQIPAAIEELMRRYAFVNTSRRVARDTEFNGVQLRKDDIVVTSLAAASNDERSVEHPEQVDLDRKKSPHLAFNTGPHNCAGVHLARMELRIFLEEWLARVPPFELAGGYKAAARGGPVMALERLDLRWN